ncbi:MAG: hypothetical protein WAO28_02875 [Candidatus Microsaccharimonas sp.]
MRIKQTIKQIITATFLMFGVTFFLFTPLNAAPTCTPSATQKCCGGVATGVLGCAQTGGDGELENTGLWGILLLVINILTAGVGVVAVGGIVYASILYTSAGGNQEQLKKAYKIITDVVIGVIAFALMYAGLNFLIPGGLFT